MRAPSVASSQPRARDFSSLMPDIAGAFCGHFSGAIAASWRQPPEYALSRLPPQSNPVKMMIFKAQAIDGKGGEC